VVDEVVQIHGGYGFIQEYPVERYYRDERINRIFEGTNEINRILITTLVLRRVRSGDIKLSLEVARAMEAFAGQSTGDVCLAETFAVEKALIANMKRLFFVLLDAAVNKYKEAIKDEQEILMALADVAINVFAIESAVLRADKIIPGFSANKSGAVKASVQVFTFNSAEKSGFAIRKAANYIAEGDNLVKIGADIRHLAGYDVPGLLLAKRQLADAAIEIEKYMF
jgi:butyryl-CoA dehydrogenase